MAATCAACLAPIVKGDKFVLSQTEVFHTRCVTSRGTANSHRARLERRVIEAESEARLAREQLQFQDRELAADRKRITELKAMHADADSSYRRMRAERDSASADIRYWRERANAAEAERDQARRDLAQRQASPATAPTAPAEPVAADPAKDDLDDAAKRFSLLELDLK